MTQAELEALAQEIYDESCVMWAQQVADILVKHRVCALGALDTWVLLQQSTCEQPRQNRRGR